MRAVLHAMDIRRRRGAWWLTCAVIVSAQPYDDLLKAQLQAEPTARFSNFCNQWQNARWTFDLNATLHVGTLKTCDGLYTKSDALAEPVLLHPRPATGPNRPPGLFPNVAAAADAGTQETVISVCSQVAASVTNGAPDKGQCPETHPFPSGEKLCCANLAELQLGNLTQCVPCVGQDCTEPRHCPSGIVDGDLTIRTAIQQWFPLQFNDIVLAAQVYKPSAGFSSANTKIALVPNIDLGTGTRAFYAAMSDPDRLRRLCFATEPTFGPSMQPNVPPPWTLALTFLGNLVPGEEIERAVGPTVTMVHDGIDITQPDGHAVITSPAVAFSWILGASASLRVSSDIQCDEAAGTGIDAKDQQALDADVARKDDGTVHTWKMFTDTSVRVGLPFASNASCFDVNELSGVPTISDMQMLCDTMAPDCVAVAARPGKACLIVARQTADGVSLPYFHDAAIDHPTEAVFSTYAAREPISRDLAHMVGVAPLGSDAVQVHPRHSVDSCRAMCWANENCTAWTLDGTDCRIMSVSQAQPMVTTDGLNLTCMEKLGFDVSPASAACSGLPLDYAFSQKHKKCVHLDDYLQQPWCPEPWTTATASQPVPELSHSGAAFASYPRATCVCGTNEHVVGASSPDGRTGLRCSGNGAAVRHPGTYSQADYKAFRVFMRTDVTVLETFACAVAEMCLDEAVARCNMVSTCVGAIVDGPTHTVEIVAGIVDTEESLLSPVGKTEAEKKRDSARLASLPKTYEAPDQIFMQHSPSSHVQEGASCNVPWMHFVDPALVCTPTNSWVKQSVDNVDNVRHGAVVCGDNNLAKDADRLRHECVDRPLLRTSPTLSDSLLSQSVNPVFVGAAPQAHANDATALYVSRVEQCVNPPYTLNVGPVVQPEVCTDTVTITSSDTEPWRNIQAEHPTMVREILQLSGCLETDAQVPSDLGPSMADLFQYAKQACDRAKTMHADATLKEFLDDGGDLNRDIYTQTGCTRKIQPDDPMSANPTYFRPDKPMRDLYADANFWRTHPDAAYRTGCCGSPTCEPVYMRKLSSVRPLPRCSVTAESCVLLTEWKKVVALGAIDTARANTSCSAVNIGQGAASLLSTPGDANVPSTRIPHYAVPYPGLLPRQIAPAAPQGHTCVPSPGAIPTTFANQFLLGDTESTQVSNNVLRSAWFATGCFNTDNIPTGQDGVSLATLLGNMRETCKQAEQGDTDAEVRCCGRAGCNVVLACPVVDPLPLPLAVCPDDTIAHRLGSGYGCRVRAFVAGVQCNYLCALDTDANRCKDQVAVQIPDVGCMLVPAQSCTQVKKWDDPDAFPCAAGVDVNGRACVGQANNDTKTCQVYAEPTQGTSTNKDAETVASACPQHEANPLHTPWAYHQQPGQCVSSVFSANLQLQESVQTSWALCEQEAAKVHANEFSYNDVTGACVVNTANTTCVTLSDVVETVRELNHYGSPKVDSSGTDLRAWIGLDGELGAKTVFAPDVTAPQVDAFVCMPKQKCGTRDAHGRCISTTVNVLSQCDLAPQLAVGFGCVTGCTSPSQVYRFVKGSINECTCNNPKNPQPCMYPLDGKAYNFDFIKEAVDPFLDDTRTRCALHTDKASCDADDACTSRPMEDDREAVYLKVQGLTSSDNCDYATYNIFSASSCAKVLGNKQPNPTYAVPELQTAQVDFHGNYAEFQESLLGQDYASAFYRSWLALPWNRDRLMAAAARKSKDENDERPFYASAIWSGAGGRDWDNLMQYDKRWMAGAAVVAMDGSGVHDGLEDLPKSSVPNVGPSVISDSFGSLGKFAAYSDRSHATPMWSPLRYWLLGAFDPFLDKGGPKVIDVKPRANKIKAEFLPRIVAFRGRQPRQDRGAEWLDDVLVDRDDAANQCLQSCDDDADCKAVSLRNGLLVSDHEPLNFVNTGGGLGAQGSTFNRPQTCPNLFQPHVSSFQYNVVRWCPSFANVAITNFIAGTAVDKFVTNDANTLSQIAKATTWRQHVFQSVFSGGLANSAVSGQAMSGQSSGQSFSDAGYVNPFDFKKDSSNHPDPESIVDTMPSYGQDWVHGMSASVGTQCKTFTTGPSSLRGKATTLGDGQCHIRLGLNHCNKCWKSQPNGGKLGTGSSTDTLQQVKAPKITCRRWKVAPLTSLGADTVVAKTQGDTVVELDDFITAHDGDVGGDFKSNDAPENCPPGYTGPVAAYSQTKMCCKGTFVTEQNKNLCRPNGKNSALQESAQALEDGVLIALGTRGKFTSINLQNHDDDVPTDPMQLGKARLQRPTPVRFRYTTIYLPKTPIDVAATRKSSTGTRYTRRTQPPVPSVLRAASSATPEDKAKVVNGDNTANPSTVNVAQAAKDVLESLGVQPDNDDSFWVQRTTVCNNRQHQRPVFTSVRCPQNLPMTCALPWPVYAQNVADNTANALSPTDYRIDGTKCVPMVAVCLQASWRYSGIQGQSLCAVAGRLLELMLDKETATSPATAFDLGVPPHIDVGSFTWPVTWLNTDDDFVNTSPFRTRRPEAPTGTVFGACETRKPCDQPPCPAGTGLAWTRAGIPFCTRVGSGSRGFQQSTRDVPKSVHSAKQAFAGFVRSASSVSGTGPALYLNAANCSDNGCGGLVTSHCDFSHVQDRAFPSCQARDRVTEACCSNEVKLVPSRMTQVEADLLRAPKTLLHAVQPRIACEAQHGLACGNAEYAVRSTHDTSCACNTAACTTGVLPNVTAASMAVLDTASVVVTQGQRCGRRVRWAPQYLTMGRGVTRCNGVDDITKGGGSVTASGGQMCGCARIDDNFEADARWPHMCDAPGGCTIQGVFAHNVNEQASCPNDVTILPSTQNLLTFSSASNECAHECMYRGPQCWAFDVLDSGACVLHVDRNSCTQIAEYVRNRPVYKAHGSPSDPQLAATVAVPSTAATAEQCADLCTTQAQCQAWGYTDDTKLCYLARTVRKYVFTDTKFAVGSVTDPNVARQVQYNEDYVAFLQANGVNTSLPINASVAAELVTQLQFSSNFSTPINVTDAEILGNITNLVAANDTRQTTPCTKTLGVLPTNSIELCAQACDFGQVSHNCTGFTINTSCTLCGQGGGTYQVKIGDNNSAIQFFAIDQGEKHITHATLQACTISCNIAPSCGYCAQVRSAAKQDQPKYIEIGTNRPVANMLLDHEYPWITDGYIKWDSECCTGAPCGQSHGPSAFAMGMCPGPAEDAHLAGPHAVSVLDTTAMRCVTQCEPKFSNAPACDECAEPHFDPASNCTQCLPSFALASDGACSLCKDPRADITTECRQCLPGFRVSDGGACLEWTCDAELQFGQQFPSVTETTDVVLHLKTGNRMATGAFVGVPEHHVPASMRSIIVRHGGNLYLLGHNARFVVEPGAVSNEAVLDIADDSDWLDTLPIALNVSQPLTRSNLMDPDGVLGHFRCGASGFQMSESELDACVSSQSAQTTDVCTNNVLGASSKQKCAEMCHQSPQCVTYVHQDNVPAVFAPSVALKSEIRASCQLYDSTQAAQSTRPRNVMVNSAHCAGAGVRVPTDGLVSYTRPNDMPVVKALDSTMQFRVVRAVDVEGKDAGCWMLSRWHKHRVVEEQDPKATAAQAPCTNGHDKVSIAWLEENVPLQGDNVRGTRLAGFMPRAITNYNLVGGTQILDRINASSACVLRCNENGTSFATRWDGGTQTCTCFDQTDNEIRVQTNVGAHVNVVLTGRRPKGVPVDGRGPVPPNCVTQAVAGTVLTMQACNDATETVFDGFVFDSSSTVTSTPRCRGLVCTGNSVIHALGTSNAIVRLHKHNVTKPVAHQLLVFAEADIDVPLNVTTQLNAATCCQQCNDPSFGANSYLFQQATGACTCYDSRARTCAPELRMNAENGRCRYCTEPGESLAVCRLVSQQHCAGVLQAENTALCTSEQSVITFSGQGVSQQCDTLQAQNTAVQANIGCDRSAGCALARRANNISAYFCAPVDRTNTDTAEWDKPPRAVTVQDASTLPDPDSMCQVMGYAKGRCSTDDLNQASSRIATCECALDTAGNAVSVCPGIDCSQAAVITKVWCCANALSEQAPCGAAATASAVVADITTVFQPHGSSSIVARIGHSNVCSSSTEFAQRFTLVRCAPQQCKAMGDLVQDALFVASSQDNVLRRVPNDSCETCGLCRHPVVYRTALFMERSVLATGASDLFNSSTCPAHMPNRIASTGACALTTWGGGPTCCPPDVVCTGRASTAPVCDVRPVLSCADLDQACKYTRHVGFECKTTASATLNDVETEDLCRQQCDIQATPPCLLYEYVAGSKLCLLGKADNLGMQKCADPNDGAAHREPNQFAVVAVKEQLPGQVCTSNTLRHYAQANHLAGSKDFVLSAVAREHSALYSLNVVDKITRLYGSFARQYRSFQLTFQKPYDVLCGIGDGANALTNCPGTLSSVLGHALAHPVQGSDDSAVEQLVFDNGAAPLAMNDNVALVASSAVLTRARQAGSNACIQQAELSVQASSQTDLISERHINRVGLNWQDGENAVITSANRTQRACLQACLEHLPTCNAFQHGSTEPLDVASCVLYVGPLPVPLSPAVRADHTVYFMNTQQSCTSPEQCVDVANFQTQSALLQQQQTFEQALQRCLQETTAKDGQPKLMGRASYVNIIKCPPQAPRPTPWHVQFFDHGPGVVCWTDLVAAPGVARDGHTTYPFTNQKPSEPEDAPDVVITDPEVSFQTPEELRVNTTTRVVPVDNCNFVRNANASAVMQSGTQNPRGFSDLNSITQCQNLDINECGTDAVCEFKQNKCTYNCNRQTCAKTLLCRGVVEDEDEEKVTCLFLPIGTDTGHMQPPSALQPCSVNTVSKMLVKPKPGVQTLLKIDCCLKLDE